MPDNQPADLIRMTEAARMLGVTTKTLKRWTNARRIPHYRVGPRKERRFDPTELRAWLAARKQAVVQKETK